ncbi:MAG: isoaspartyl peptidase/L-asparaginase [Flavobacteriaceae bacterium]|nr:isoaspartyl peptidase/L-asparaginase [Flavobacteriaceae bacterium]
MNKLFLLFLTMTLISSCQNSENTNENKNATIAKFSIVIHGGAGGIERSNFTEAQETAYKQQLEISLNAGYKILEDGGSAINAVQAAIVILEDSPLFNAGKGAVFNSEGLQEMDASIMNGYTLNTGAVAGINHVKNPILAANKVLDSSKHVLLSGKGAEILVKKYGIQMVPSSYFYTDKRFQQLQKILGKNKISKDHSALLQVQPLIDDHKYGTVGAVAYDKSGSIAAGTSTGGMTNKKYGRIGDSPIIGAGTYANNTTCGISSTGTGEYFIRTVAAHEVSSILKYTKSSPKKALQEVIFNQIAPLGGKGGMILIDKNASVFWDFNTKGMFRGYKKSTGETVIELFEKTAYPKNKIIK